MPTHRAGLVAGCCLLLVAPPAAVADSPKVIGGYQYVPGLGGTMLLLQGDELVRLGPDGVTEKERRRLPAKYTHIAERATTFVALQASPPAVRVLDKATLKPVRGRELPYHSLSDLALHPKLPVAYVAAEFDSTAPSHRVVVFDESTGDAREPRGCFGTWVRVHPAGTFLVTGHRDIYERGTQFFINPGWKLHAVPDYGSIDLLISYKLDGTGVPTFMDLKTKAGGNGTGLRMSADGERVAYPSHVGTPQYSRNLAAFDPLDLQKVPVGYPAKDRASTQDLAFHPSLPLCAAPGLTGTVVFYHRETGEVEERVEKSARFERVHRVHFAPDGRHVVVDGDLASVRALRAVPLKLSPQEVAAVARPADPGAVDNAAKVEAAAARGRQEVEKKIDPAKAARDKAVDWLKLNNTLGPDHKLVADMTAAIDDELAAGRNFYLTFGKGLCKGGTATVVGIWNGTFVVVPLTAEQDKALDVPRMSAVKRPGGKAGWRLTEPRAQLFDLKIADAAALDGKKKLTGTVRYRRLVAEPAEYALKIEYKVGDATVIGYHHLGVYLADGEGEFTFSFGPLVGEKQTHKGPMPVFMELVCFPTPDRRGETAIAANTVVQIVNVKGK